jgi:hypothetical protein
MNELINLNMTSLKSTLITLAEIVIKPTAEVEHVGYSQNPALTQNF